MEKNEILIRRGKKLKKAIHNFIFFSNVSTTDSLHAFIFDSDSKREISNTTVKIQQLVRTEKLIFGRNVFQIFCEVNQLNNEFVSTFSKFFKQIDSIKTKKDLKKSCAKFVSKSGKVTKKFFKNYSEPNFFGSLQTQYVFFIIEKIFWVLYVDASSKPVRVSRKVNSDKSLERENILLIAKIYKTLKGLIKGWLPDDVIDHVNYFFLCVNISVTKKYLNKFKPYFERHNSKKKVSAIVGQCNSLLKNKLKVKIEEKVMEKKMIGDSEFVMKIFEKLKIDFSAVICEVLLKTKLGDPKVNKKKTSESEEDGEEDEDEDEENELERFINYYNNVSSGYQYVKNNFPNDTCEKVLEILKKEFCLDFKKFFTEDVKSSLKSFKDIKEVSDLLNASIVNLEISKKEISFSSLFDVEIKRYIDVKMVSSLESIINKINRKEKFAFTERKREQRTVLMSGVDFINCAFDPFDDLCELDKIFSKGKDNFLVYFVRKVLYPKFIRFYEKRRDILSDKRVKRKNKIMVIQSLGTVMMEDLKDVFCHVKVKENIFLAFDVFESGSIEDIKREKEQMKSLDEIQKLKTSVESSKGIFQVSLLKELFQKLIKIYMEMIEHFAKALFDDFTKPLTVLVKSLKYKEVMKETLTSEFIVLNENFERDILLNLLEQLFKRMIDKITDLSKKTSVITLNYNKFKEAEQFLVEFFNDNGFGLPIDILRKHTKVLDITLMGLAKKIKEKEKSKENIESLPVLISKVKNARVSTHSPRKKKGRGIWASVGLSKSNFGSAILPKQFYEKEYQNWNKRDLRMWISILTIPYKKDIYSAFEKKAMDGYCLAPEIIGNNLESIEASLKNDLKMKNEDVVKMLANEILNIQKVKRWNVTQFLNE